MFLAGFISGFLSYELIIVVRGFFGLFTGFLTPLAYGYLAEYIIKI